MINKKEEKIVFTNSTLPDNNESVYSNKNSEDKALRFDDGKIRHDLLPGHALNELAKVYTMGAKKYADNNWRKGMKWSRVLASLKRHLNYIENGVDFDDESKLLHAAHVAWNAITLLEYYKIYPQGDDRCHTYLEVPKIGLDIDDVLADFVPAYIKKFNLPVPEFWNFRYDTLINLKEITKDKEFYISLKPKVSPKDIPFEPHCYITSRSIPKEWTEEWLQNNGFACKPVYTVDFEHSKLQVAKESGIDIYVDDRYDNFVELNKNGICTYLFDTPWNQRYNVGYKRIKSLKELM